jgi:membrane associated rhomboid family serine protease
VGLWSIAVVLALVAVTLEGVAVLRRGAGEQRGYFLLLLVDGALLGFGASDPRFGQGQVTALAAAGVALCALTVVVPALIERAVRRAVAQDRLAAAARLASVKELLQPGRAATAEREQLQDLAAASSGRADEVLRALRGRLVAAEPPEDLQLHARVVTVLAAAGRHREAVTHFETHLARVGTPIGLALQVLRSYALAGELELAAQAAHRIEQAARNRDPQAMAALPQARLMLLAAASGRAALHKLLALPELKRIPPRLLAQLEELAAAREAIEPPEEVQRFAAQMAERLVAEVEQSRAPSRPPPATLSLIALNCLCFALFVSLLGHFDSGYDLVRGGASLHAAVRTGEWWRLWSAMFLHGGESLTQGLMHLGLNMYGLWLLGRIVEPLFGAPRFLIVYAAGGLLGNLASVYNPRPEAILSLGASGAVMGLMGALLVILLVRRGVWPEESRRALVVNVLVLLVAQLAIGVVIAHVDNVAHVGGLVGGAAAALALVPGGVVRGRWGRVLVASLLVVIGASAGASAVGVARERVAGTAARAPRQEARVGTIHMSLPAWAMHVVPEAPEWPGEERWIDPITDLAYAPHLVPTRGGGPTEAIAACIARDRAAVAEEARRSSKPTPTLAEVPAPPVAGWTAAALGDHGAPAGTPPALYYARVAPAGGEALVVEVNYEGRPPLPAPSLEELARVLASTRVDK